MKVVGLVSGGKDSCFNLIQCASQRNDIVALANVCPPNGLDEMDSQMFQTVGHEIVELLAEAMELPLYRKVSTALALSSEIFYNPTEGDEVEDLFHLLSEVKRQHPEIEGVSVGAVLSTYQKNRVENVCTRLKLVPLAFLWQKNETDLLNEMLLSGLNAVVIKVAALGLNPSHLGMTLKELQPHLLEMNEKYGLHVCGEGGEYETLTLDCSLFKKRIQLDDYEILPLSKDPFAPSAFLKIHSASLHLKENYKDTGFRKKVVHVKQPLT
ncbi:diphthine--ammonia ligase-like [Zophobas morio]|uniref:diphthine--ammonia ligase-like n=1 Tax=Zophobas morio TaxID=2755281 RepID=UPI0030826C31